MKDREEYACQVERGLEYSLCVGYGMKGEGERERETEGEGKERERGEEKLTFLGEKEKKEFKLESERRSACLGRWGREWAGLVS